MSAFENTRAAADRHTADDGPDVVVQAGELIIRESRSAWLSSTAWVEVRQ